jgi:hypothetical protein
VIGRGFARWVGLVMWTPSLVTGAFGCSGSGATDAGSGGEGRRVLFVGNSLTYTNGLPGMVQGLARTAGLPPLRVGSVTASGVSLQDLWLRGEAPTTIAEGRWAVVVLQQGPSSLPANRAHLREWTQRYASEIRKAGGEPALYMVWPVDGWAGDFDAVSESYTLAAHDVGGILFPVGEAFRLARSRDASVTLFSTDGFHPSLAGSYLAALVMIGRLYDRSPVGLPTRFAVGSATIDIPANLASLLQAAAAEANERFTR